MARIYGKGQVVLPKPVRDKLGLHAGDELSVEVRGSEIVLRKAPSIFEHRPPRPRRDVGLSDEETLAAAREEHVTSRYGRRT